MQLAHDAAADHDNVLADLEVAALDGVEHAGQRLGEAGLLQGQVIVDHIDLVAVEQHVLLEAADARVGHPAAVGLVAVLAEVALVVTAGVAVAAGVERAGSDVLAHGELLLVDALANGRDDAGDLMAADEGLRHVRDAGEHALLEGAERAAQDADEHLARLHLRLVDRADLSLVEFRNDDDVHLFCHGSSFSQTFLKGFRN